MQEVHHGEHGYPYQHDACHRTGSVNTQGPGREEGEGGGRGNGEGCEGAGFSYFGLADVPKQLLDRQSSFFCLGLVSIVGLG